MSSLAKTGAMTFNQNFVWPQEEGDLQWHWQTDKQTNKRTQKIRLRKHVQTISFTNTNLWKQFLFIIKKKYKKLATIAYYQDNLLKQTLAKNFVNKNVQYIFLGNLVTTKLRQTFFVVVMNLNFVKKACCKKKLVEIFCVHKEKCDKKTYKWDGMILSPKTLPH